MENVHVVKIRYEFELAKIVAFVRARVRGVRFALPSHLIDPMLELLESDFANAGVRAVIEVVRPDGTSMTLWVGVGIVAGAATGWLLAGPVGATVGASVGGVAGVLLTTIRIRLETAAHGDSLLSLEAA